MPALDKTVIDDLNQRLQRYLAGRSGYGEPTYLTSGGSAAVYAVPSEAGTRAFKAFNPVFLEGSSGPAERRRLELQRRLIGHTCTSLVQTHAVDEAEGTAFIEMEYVGWQSLKDLLNQVPDEAIVPLFTQLVSAVKYLDEQNIVHRDIKPENIHVSEDFSKLKLLDLGVARETHADDIADAAVTDHGGSRPFLATAQYSSPEYLFRLDEPSLKLWKGLTFYQLGAVLHDLINKEPIFKNEMSAGNRWLVARAVLTCMPTFTDGNLARLSNLKSLALRCLVKDLDARLQLVGWDDFILEGATDPLTTLRARLAKGRPPIGGQIDAANASRLEFDRTEFFRRFAEMVRTELLQVCGTNMPLTLHLSTPSDPQSARILLAVNQSWNIEADMSFIWQKQIYERTTNINLSVTLLASDHNKDAGTAQPKLAITASISDNEAENAIIIARKIATAVGQGLDRLENYDDSIHNLHGTDLLS